MLAELKLESDGGQSVQISTDSTWRTHYGAVLYNQMREGEIYDAREEKRHFRGLTLTRLNGIMPSSYADRAESLKKTILNRNA